MSEKFPGDFSPEEQERKEIIDLRHLAQRYHAERFIIDGIDQEARENNLLVIEAIQAAGKKLDLRSDEVFGIHMGGSRIRGYNTKDSDIDLVVVVPDTTTDTSFISDLLRKELEIRDIKNDVDMLMGSWSQHEIKTDPEELIHQVDHHADELVTLFGYTPYSNANLNLARLSVLEVIGQSANSGWEAAAENFAKTYLGERSHVIEKCAERYGVPAAEVAKIFPESLFMGRYKKFGIEQPGPIHTELKKWYSSYKKDLQQYRMHGVYKGVLRQLKAGF